MYATPWGTMTEWLRLDAAERSEQRPLTRPVLLRPRTKNTRTKGASTEDNAGSRRLRPVHLRPRTVRG